MPRMADIVRMEEIGGTTVADVNTLLGQLSDDYKPVTESGLQTLFSNPNFELWAAQDDQHLVGIASLITVNKLTGVSTRVEHVVVDEKYRGQGLGVKLMEKMIERSRAMGAKRIVLTSRPSREAANKLYQKMGFQLKETNSYYLDL